MLYFFFFNDTATTEIYTLSLHDALPIFHRRRRPAHQPTAVVHGGGHDREAPRLRGLYRAAHPSPRGEAGGRADRAADGDRKSTRLNSSHANISYAVFCLKKKNIKS